MAIKNKNKIKNLIQKVLKEQLNPAPNPNDPLVPDDKSQVQPVISFNEYESINDAVWRITSIEPNYNPNQTPTDYEGAICTPRDRKMKFTPKFKKGIR